MLAKTNQKTSFEQFLFSHFELKKCDASVVKTDFCVADKNNTVVKKTKTCKANKKLVVKAAKKESKQIEACDVKKKEVATEAEDVAVSLAEAISSIPEKTRSMNVKELAHKHESEWYHTFKDLQDEIADDLAKKHPDYNGVLKFKSEIKEFWEQLDEHIEKAILELERIFQAYPNMSRVAVIYLLSIIIAVPLVFFSANQIDKVSVNSAVNNKVTELQTKTIKFTKEMKADYVAQNSAKILASGKTFVQVTKGSRAGRVAGAYEDNNTNLPANNIKRKISAYYKYFSNLKDELDYFVKDTFSN